MARRKPLDWRLKNRKILKILVCGVLTVVLLIVVALAVVFLVFPRVEPASDVVIDRFPERIERGRYLVEHVATCLNCHSERDWDLYGGPLIAGTKGQGAPLRVPRPSVFSANITPFGIGEMSDGEVVRAITSGIGRDSETLHVFMPYDTYAALSQEDVYSIVAYLRTLGPIENVPPKPKEGLAFTLIGRILPKPYQPPPPPDVSDRVAYGQYLVKIAECDFCHGSDFSGGRALRVPGGGRVVASNITPAASNKFGSWSRENFIGVLKSFAGHESRQVPAQGENTVMPWLQNAGMTEEDLGAIYDYLRTFEPVEDTAESE